jgi:hypothetical protein
VHRNVQSNEVLHDHAPCLRAGTRWLSLPQTGPSESNRNHPIYSIKTRRGDLARKFGLSDNRMAAFDPLEAIFPGHMAPIIKQSEDGARELVMRSWGFILLREGYAPKRVTNTRDDKAHTKFWKDSFEKRRCLVPATAFCEPLHEGICVLARCAPHPLRPLRRVRAQPQSGRLLRCEPE